VAREPTQPLRVQSPLTGEERKRKPAEKLNPEQLRFTEWELADMKNLARLFRTPRAVKRFVNTYRLVRVSVPPAELASFEGTAKDPGGYRMALVLLAIVSGYPNLAPRFLQQLRDQSRVASGKSTWSKFLDHCIALAAEEQARAQLDQAKTRAGATAKEQAASTTRKSPTRRMRKVAARDIAYYWQEWIQLCERLREISSDDYLPGDLSGFYDLVPRIARFSFSANMMPE